MSSILASIRDLITSAVSLVAGIFAQIFHGLEHALSACIHFVASTVAMFQDVFLGLTKAVGGVTSFLIGNIMMLALLGGAGYLLLAYRREAGRKPAAGRRPIAAQKN